MINYSDTTPDIDYDYDRQGRMKEAGQAYATPLTTTYTYNDADQLLTKAFAGSHLGGLGGDRVYDDKLRLTSVSWKSGSTLNDTTQYAYHAQHGRLNTVTKSGEVMTYGYLAQSDWVETITYGASSHLSTQRVYDGLDRLEHIDSTISTVATPFVSTYRHNNANQRDRVSAQDGSYWEYEYDNLGQITSGKRHWLNDTEVLGQTFTYQHDDIGNREIAGGRASSDSDYVHDRRNELTADTNLNRSVDVIGLADPATAITVNTQAATRQGGYYHKAVTSSGNGASMETITVSDGTQSSSGDVFIPGTGVRNYDDDGNLLQDGRWHYLWDAENRLIQMHSVSEVPTAEQRRIEFKYDHAGRRIAKHVFNQVTGGTLLNEHKYLYDGWNLIAELNNSNTATMTYAWGLDMSGTLQGAGGVGGLLLVTDHATGKDHYVDIDGQGNVRRLVDSSDGSLSAEYEYGPFGEPLRATGTMAGKNRFRFSTKFDDTETRLLYYGMRYYNPVTGRWISRDPIGEDGGLNLYGFVGNDPVNDADYIGMEAILKPIRALTNPCDDSSVAARILDCAITINAGHAYFVDEDSGEPIPGSGIIGDAELDFELFMKGKFNCSKFCYVGCLSGDLNDRAVERGYGVPGIAPNIHPRNILPGKHNRDLLIEGLLNSRIRQAIDAARKEARRICKENPCGCKDITIGVQCNGVESKLCGYAEVVKCR